MISTEASVSLIETASAFVPGVVSTLPERVADSDPGGAKLAGLQHQRDLVAAEAVEHAALPLPARALLEVEAEDLAGARVGGGAVAQQPLR